MLSRVKLTAENEIFWPHYSIGFKSSMFKNPQNFTLTFTFVSIQNNQLS